ncbi:MAG TPA: SRPBCC family protein [Nocardioidaceae bacterium]|nr:SRPBCC family protein [Nocardioidaceae bacterium]
MIRVSKVVDATAEDLWRKISDVAEWDSLLPTVDKVTRLDGGGPIAVGSRFEVHQPGLAKAVYEITEWRPDAGFTWVAAAPGVRTTATHELAAEGRHTRLVLGIDWSGPLAWLVRLMFGAKARRMVELEADTFARLAHRQ